MNSEETKAKKETQTGEMPIWMQWVIALIALGLGAWFGWMMF